MFLLVPNLMRMILLSESVPQLERILLDLFSPKTLIEKHLLRMNASDKNNQIQGKNQDLEKLLTLLELLILKESQILLWFFYSSL